MVLPEFDHLTLSERRVLYLIAARGALTTRRITRQLPRPTWKRLLDLKLLTEYHTTYGLVLGLGRPGYQALRNTQTYTPYLLAPGSVVDRAFQIDAIDLLRTQGYAVSRLEYKLGNQRDEAGRPMRTDQIKRMVMQAPSPQPLPASQPDMWQLYPEMRGHPSLYASVSGGGINLTQLRKLAKRHQFDTSTWKHPLLIAVPDDSKIRNFVRAEDAKRRQVREAMVRDGQLRDAAHIPNFQVLLLPPDLDVESFPRLHFDAL